MNRYSDFMKENQGKEKIEVITKNRSQKSEEHPSRSQHFFFFFFLISWIRKGMLLVM